MGNPDWRTIPGFVLAGTLGKSHGTAGELRVRIEPGMEEAVISAPFIFVDLHGSKVPHSVEAWRQTKDLIVQLGGVHDRAQAVLISGKEFYLPVDEVTSEPPVPVSDLKYGFLLQYTVHSGGQEVGQIVDIQEFPQQEIAIVHVGESDVMIPLHEKLIDEIDQVNRIVVMSLPDGLLDL